MLVSTLDEQLSGKIGFMQSLALPDAADKNLLEKSRLSLLLPSLGESAASVLELAVGGSLVSPIVRAKARTK